MIMELCQMKVTSTVISGRGNVCVSPQSAGVSLACSSPCKFGDNNSASKLSFNYKVRNLFLLVYVFC